MAWYLGISSISDTIVELTPLVLRENDFAVAWIQDIVWLLVVGRETESEVHTLLIVEDKVLLEVRMLHRSHDVNSRLAQKLVELVVRVGCDDEEER